MGMHQGGEAGSQQYAVARNGAPPRSFSREDGARVLQFALAADQELAERAASHPVILQVLEGEVRVTLGLDGWIAAAGSRTCIPAGVGHRIAARTPVVMLLIEIGGRGSDFSVRRVGAS